MTAPGLTIEAGESGQSHDEYACLRQMWAQMLLVALDDLKRGSDFDRRTARRWIFDESPRRFGFVWVCGVLDLDPDAVRERVSRMPQRVGRGFRRERAASCE